MENHKIFTICHPMKQFTTFSLPCCRSNSFCLVLCLMGGVYSVAMTVSTGLPLMIGCAVIIAVTWQLVSLLPSWLKVGVPRSSGGSAATCLEGLSSSDSCEMSETERIFVQKNNWEWNYVILNRSEDDWVYFFNRHVFLMNLFKLWPRLAFPIRFDVIKCWLVQKPLKTYYSVI